jgi:serine/threonine-protein kinase PknK
MRMEEFALGPKIQGAGQGVGPGPVSDKLATPRVGPWQCLERVGEGSAGVVWRARHVETRQVVALKIAKDHLASGEALAREAALLVRVARRWGPALIDNGAGYVATEWIEGAVLDPGRLGVDRVTTAAVLAHAIGRALEELHEAQIRHGDVKPENILVAARTPREDAASERGATLIDLGLAGSVAAPALGGTPRYAAPELREHGDGGPAADLWALGVLLAEVLDEHIALVCAGSEDVAAAVAGWDRARASEPARWVQALLAKAPGGRPDAAWIATRAARWLGLAARAGEAELARVERVRRTYLSERARDLTPGAAIDESVTEPARTWLAKAVALQGKTAEASNDVIAPLSAVRRTRWLVSLAGPTAASWALGTEFPGEGELAARAVELARSCDPSSWALGDLVGASTPNAAGWSLAADDDRAAQLVRELGRAHPHPAALALAEDDVARSTAAPTVARELVAALVRTGRIGRAWAAASTLQGPPGDAIRGELARRRGDRTAAEAYASAAAEQGDATVRSTARATLARIAWDSGNLAAASQWAEEAHGAAGAEVRALIAWRRGDYDQGLAAVSQALADTLDTDARGRLEGARAMLELGRGASAAALDAFGRAVDLSARAGAVVEEATYLTNDAAAAADAGAIGRAIASATRSALLWERLGRPERAARAWLARAGALATLAAQHATDEAAQEAEARAVEAGDTRTAAYADWARVEVRAPGDADARRWAIAAAEKLRDTGVEDEVRAGARLLVWAPDALDPRQVAAYDEAAARTSAPARWEWWGARAQAAGNAADASTILSRLLALVDEPALLGSRGPALDAAVRLATQAGDGAAARRFDHARVAAARLLHEGAPPELRASLASVAWARTTPNERADLQFAPEQIAQLETIVRALSGRDRLRPLLEQVLDTLVLWTGVERGLLLLRVPDGRLVPRVARNLARHDLTGEQLALSQTIARRALETGEAVVATDALSTLGDLHASVHALRLRSVVAVPLLARGEALGVVYLDDRVRRGAFGARELAWVRVVASQAALAIADARDAVLLRRAARRAERARARLEAVLGQREAELDVTRTQLDLARGEPASTRFPYDEIAGRSEPMRDLLRLVDRVTASEVPLLIVGESGTGKELVARAVHKNGPRARRAFVSENCASVPETLLESTLFGHVRGAFTGASSTRPGLFDVADGGTLFLDEIGEMSLGMQTKLLRVLQDGEVRAVGNERVRKVDVRVIGATHRDLSAMVAAGTFREDLFYRLNVVTLSVPALRERPEDIPLLVDHLIRKHAPPDRPAKVTRAALAKLAAYPWPGNVRQLENELRRALVMSDGTIDVADLSADVVRGGPSVAVSGGLDLRKRVDALEAELVSEALVKTRGNQTRAAQLLGLSRFGLQKMMKRLGVRAPVLS